MLAAAPAAGVSEGAAARVRALEAYLARLHTDAAERAAFMGEPAARALRAGLDAEASAALAAIDLGALELAARGCEHKRAALHAQAVPWLVRVVRQLGA